MESQLQGNVCTCGEVWFTIMMPESSPSRCPYCARMLDQGESYDPEGDNKLSNIPEDQQEMFESEKCEESYKKATGSVDINLVSKVCKFCTNEIYFDSKDAPKAKYCPYCTDDKGMLIDSTNIDDVLLDNIPQDGIIPLDELEINKMVDDKVEILIKSFNPFSKPKEYIFKGLDYITMIVKLQNINDKSIKWIAFEDIKYIKKSE